MYLDAAFSRVVLRMQIHVVKLLLKPDMSNWVSRLFWCFTVHSFMWMIFQHTS